MIAKVLTASLYGHLSFLVEVEVNILVGVPQIQIVGLGDNAVRESKERIRSSIINSNFKFPVKHIVVNLAPSDQQKQGNICELAIAIGILIASNQISEKLFSNTIVLGALSLNGQLADSKGILTTILSLVQKYSQTKFLIPQKSINSISKLCLKNVFYLENLKELSLPHPTRKLITKVFHQSKVKVDVDMQQIKGNLIGKKGLSYSAIGKHHTIFIGVPGSGKTLLARAMSGILPAMSLKESLEVTQIHSTLSSNEQSQIILQRPFRSPHHTSSHAALVGGGSIPQPGEISLAHQGVLFLDELLEFDNKTLQSLREPLEEKAITISRSLRKVYFPANFILIGATNPCRCGYFFSNQKCSCTKKQIQTLLNKIMGPFLDRISIEIECSVENSNYLLEQTITNEKTSSWWYSKINEAQNRMFYRNKNIYNSDVQHTDILKIIQQKTVLKKIIQEKNEKLQLSHRGLINTLQVSMSIMDFQEKSSLTENILLEAFSYRCLFKYKQALLISG